MTGRVSLYAMGNVQRGKRVDEFGRIGLNEKVNKSVKSCVCHQTLSSDGKQLWRDMHVWKVCEPIPAIKRQLNPKQMLSTLGTKMDHFNANQVSKTASKNNK
ncbi:MAG: hypothetical protein ABW185_15605 [Sedimenticola sp.]